MPRGGARKRSGPGKDPNALRRDEDGFEFITLPSEREGPIPEWPLNGGTKRELDLWAREWRRPQAVMWERGQMEMQVAMYVRQTERCERKGAATSDRTLLLRMMGDLGLTQAAMGSFGWMIPDPNAKPAERRLAQGGGSSVKDRFKVVDGGA